MSSQIQPKSQIWAALVVTIVVATLPAVRGEWGLTLVILGSGFAIAAGTAYGQGRARRAATKQASRSTDP